MSAPGRMLSPALHKLPLLERNYLDQLCGNGASTTYMFSGLLIVNLYNFFSVLLTCFSLSIFQSVIVKTASS